MEYLKKGEYKIEDVATLPSIRGSREAYKAFGKKPAREYPLNLRIHFIQTPVHRDLHPVLLKYFGGSLSFWEGHTDKNVLRNY